jgi:membrane-bound metal-dependent hydrolase YbcI (DUF457 family)
MSSPVAHLACGFAVYRILVAADPKVAGLPRGTRLPTAAIFSMAPDLDLIAGWLAHDLPAYHNNVSHSFTFGLLACLIAATVASTAWKHLRFLPLWLYTFGSYASHILVDYVTRGRGVMLWWPFIPERFSSPILLFRGVSWSKGLHTNDHWWTLANDAVFALVVIALAEIIARGLRARAASVTTTA